MNRPNITPGPWSWQPQGDRKYVLPRHYCMNSYTGRGLASIVVKSEDEVWPNSPDARAIAAVPDLLAFAETCYRDADSLSEAELRTMVHHMSKQALTKAGFTADQ